MLRPECTLLPVPRFVAACAGLFMYIYIYMQTVITCVAPGIYASHVPRIPKAAQARSFSTFTLENRGTQSPFIMCAAYMCACPDKCCASFGWCLTQAVKKIATTPLQSERCWDQNTLKSCWSIKECRKPSRPNNEPQNPKSPKPYKRYEYWA